MSLCNFEESACRYITRRVGSGSWLYQSYRAINSDAIEERHIQDYENLAAPDPSFYKGIKNHLNTDGAIPRAIKMEGSVRGLYVFVTSASYLERQAGERSRSITA